MPRGAFAVVAIALLAACGSVRVAPATPDRTVATPGVVATAKPPVLTPAPPTPTPTPATRPWPTGTVPPGWIEHRRENLRLSLPATWFVTLAAGAELKLSAVDPLPDGSKPVRLDLIRQRQSRPFALEAIVDAVVSTVTSDAATLGAVERRLSDVPALGRIAELRYRRTERGATNFVSAFVIVRGVDAYHLVVVSPSERDDAVRPTVERIVASWRID